MICGSTRIGHGVGVCCCGGGGCEDTGRGTWDCGREGLRVERLIEGCCCWGGRREESWVGCVGVEGGG